MRKMQKGGTLQKKKKNSPSRESTKIPSRPGSTTNPRSGKSASTVKKTKPVAPKMKTGIDKKNVNDKTIKQMTVDALKKAPVGSNKRRLLYDRLNWKQDATTTGNKAKVKAKKKTVNLSGGVKGKVSTAKKASVSKPASKISKKVSATRAKGAAALASGNKAKALRMKKREARQMKRASRKAKK